MKNSLKQIVLITPALMGILSVPTWAQVIAPGTTTPNGQVLPPSQRPDPPAHSTCAVNSTTTREPPTASARWWGQQLQPVTRWQTRRTITPGSGAMGVPPMDGTSETPSRFRPRHKPGSSSQQQLSAKTPVISPRIQTTWERVSFTHWHLRSSTSRITELTGLQYPVSPGPPQPDS